MSASRFGLLCAVAFAMACAAGYFECGRLLSHFRNVMEMGFSLGEHMASGKMGVAAVGAGVFLKNASVVLLCVSLGRATRGLFPVFVSVVNGLLLGCLAGTLASVGIPVWRFAAALAPHGAFELPAIFAACGIGVLALGVRERLRKSVPVLAILAVAAAVEVTVSPMVANFLL